jgi:hypothetical protein
MSYKFDDVGDHYVKLIEYEQISINSVDVYPLARRSLSSRVYPAGIPCSVYTFLQPMRWIQSIIIPNELIVSSSLFIIVS